MIIRFNDIEGNVFLVPKDNVTCCVAYVCCDDGCNKAYHYNVVIGRTEIEVEREEFMKVYHHIVLTPLSPAALAEIPEQSYKTKSKPVSTEKEYRQISGCCGEAED